jgi:8-hydroxy-5-deazaflavin:NADPH oxidoreductase
MTVVGIIGTGELGSQLARAAVRAGYEVVIANSRGPETLGALVAELGPAATAATAEGAASAGDVVILSFPYRRDHDLPVAALEGKIVIDTNNYMAFRDGRFPEVDAGLTTVHEMRQAQLPGAKIAKAFTHIQGPSLLRFARPGATTRHALAVSSDYPEAVEFVTRFYDDLGFDTVDNSPLSESWRSAPGTPMWRYHAVGQGRDMLAHNLASASRPG